MAGGLRGGGGRGFSQVKVRAAAIVWAGFFAIFECFSG